MATGSRLHQTRKLNSKRGELALEEDWKKEVEGRKVVMLSKRLACLRASPALGLILALIIADRVSDAGYTSAQYSSPQNIIQLNCDSTRLIRCQNDILRVIHAFSGSSSLDNVQYPISGPPYSPSKQVQQQQPIVESCRLMRSNLECLLLTTPACYEQGAQAAQNTDLILRAKRFIEQNNCNGPDSSTWRNTFCYTSPDIKRCEERYDLAGFNTISSISLANNITACRTYQAFRHCVEIFVRDYCRVKETDMLNEYLIDKASDLSWRCPANSSTQASLLYSPYQLNNQPGAILSPSGYNNFGSYDQQRPIYVASQAGSSQFLGSRDQLWERFRSPADELNSNYPGVGRFPFGTNDKLVALNGGFEVGQDNDCYIKAAPYARECEDNLRAQQRLLATDSRDGVELERRTCCSLFQLRDCVSRVVIDRCADATPVAVDLLMGQRRREMTISCRAFNRDICSGSMAEAVSNLPLLLAVAILTSFMTFKQATGTHLATISL